MSKALQKVIVKIITLVTVIYESKPSTRGWSTHSPFSSRSSPKKRALPVLPGKKSTYTIPILKQKASSKTSLIPITTTTANLQTEDKIGSFENEWLLGNQHRPLTSRAKPRLGWAKPPHSPFPSCYIAPDQGNQLHLLPLPCHQLSCSPASVGASCLQLGPPQPPPSHWGLCLAPGTSRVVPAASLLHPEWHVWRIFWTCWCLVEMSKSSVQESLFEELTVHVCFQSVVKWS